MCWKKWEPSDSSLTVCLLFVRREGSFYLNAEVTAENVMLGLNFFRLKGLVWEIEAQREERGYFASKFIFVFYAYLS